MTTERSGMSLEQVRAELYEYWADADSSNTKRGYKRLIDAIDAHLSRDAVVSDEDVHRACETFDPVGWKVMGGDARSDFKESVRRMLESFADRHAVVPDGWKVERGDDGESIWLRNGIASIRYWRNDGLFHWFLDDMLAQRDGGS